MNLEKLIVENVKIALENLYNQSVDDKLIQVQSTRKDFEGDYTLVVFPFLKISKKNPEQTALEIGNFLKENVSEIADYNIVKGFLNLSISNLYWLSFFNRHCANPSFGHIGSDENSPKIMIEYSSPNTNKPLHLGHIRNNLLGFSVSQILKAAGKEVVMVNLVNDRGIHICKSMLAWQKFGNASTPSSSGKKGDHLVGEYYVKFDVEYKKQIAELITQGRTEEQAKKEAPILLEAQEMLRKWEAKDTEIYSLWKEMNSWVYDGFEKTYKKLGVYFDKMYYESETYLLGKQNVIDGLKKGVLIQKDDSSVWADLTADGLDEKILLRSDGTSVYMTQDIGTAILRHNEFNADEMTYVVGNEQDYHFKVLSLVLQKLGYEWGKKLHHLSYGMVELPKGKMKSREGTVVDADDLIDEMIETARKTSQELGKLDGLSPEEAEKVYYTIAMGALKYFILKVDPRKNMTFNPNESIDFNGNTGPFIQYTYARIQSILRKAKEQEIEIPNEFNYLNINKKEIDLLKYLHRLPQTVQEAAAGYSPALIANFVYELVKEFNQFYHEFSILKETDENAKKFRLMLSKSVAYAIKNCMNLLGIDVPERM